MTIIAVNHFNSMNEMQLNPTGLRMKCMVRHLIIISLSVKGNIGETVLLVQKSLW